jgi:murein peptide amidase A
MSLKLLLLLQSAVASPSSQVWHSSFVAGHSVTGRPIRVEQLGSGPEVVLFLAAIHGNEWGGTPLVQSLMQALRSQPELLEGKTVVIAPVVNPDGKSDSLRGNMNWVDLNRNFPSENYGRSYRKGPRPVSEPETETMLWLFETYEPSRVITIHEPLECIDYDGPAEGLATAIAAASGLPLQKVGERSGSLGSYLGNALQTEVVTIELPFFAHRKSPEVLWERYSSAMLASVLYPEELAGPVYVELPQEEE